MRGINASLQEALRGKRVRPFLLYHGVFETGDVRLWSGLGPLVWDGNEYTGAGTLLAISPIEETTEVRASGWTATLSGVSQESVSLAIDETRQGAEGSLYLGFFDDDDSILDVVAIGRGKLDVPSIEEDGETCSIQITYEGVLVDLERPRISRYTHESQQARFPGDKGFEHVAGLQQKQVVWGRPT